MSLRRTPYFTRHGILGFLFGLAFTVAIVMLAQIGALYALSLVSSIDAGSVVSEHWPIVLFFSVAASLVLIFRKQFYGED